MKITITKEGVKTVGKIGLNIGKHIVVEGTKAVLLQGAVRTYNNVKNGGVKQGLKDMTVDKFLGDDIKEIKEEKPKKEKRSWFKKEGKKTEDSIKTEGADIQDAVIIDLVEGVIEFDVVDDEVKSEG